MPGLNVIIDMCRNGQVQEAYNLAKNDLEQGKPWAVLTTSRTLYYLIKDDAEKGLYDQLVAHIDELSALSPQELTNGHTVFWIGYYAKKHLEPKSISTPIRLSQLYSKLKGFSYAPSVGYSALLEGFIRCEAWQELNDFIDWWNLENLLPEDYKPIKTTTGVKIISIAERAFIAKSKALLRLNDPGRIEEFLPLMDNLMDNHPEMTYPGYFYGKLLLALGGTAEDALRVIIPFARKKATEFWTWQLLSDVFVNDQDKQLACLLRAVHCHTQEKFLGRVRIKLAKLFIQRNQLDYARYQIDKVTQCFLSQGWHLPHEVECWIHQPWINTVSPKSNSPIDYLSITDSILFEGVEEAIAVVTNVDANSHRASLVYGYEKRTFQKLRIKVEAGSMVKINYITESDGKIRILSSVQTRYQDNLDYAKVVEGVIHKNPDKDFAFLKTNNEDYFVSPNVVRKYGIQGGEMVKSLVVYDYNKKKEAWKWACISIY